MERVVEEGEGESVKGFGDGSEMRRRVKLRQWRG